MTNTIDKIINLIDYIISKNYDKRCRYIIKIDKNTYKGDMACLSAFGNDVVDNLKKNKLMNKIKLYNIYNKKTNELEDFLED